MLHANTAHAAVNTLQKRAPMRALKSGRRPVSGLGSPCRGIVGSQLPARHVKPLSPPQASHSSNGYQPNNSSNSVSNDDIITPLVSALENAKKQVQEAQLIREGLEAEAQIVAERAVAAKEARDVAMGQLSSTARELEYLKRTLEEKRGRVTRLQNQARDAQSRQFVGNDVEMLRRDLQREISELDSTEAALTRVLQRVDTISATASAAEQAAARADEMTAKAMHAVETSVKEEMESMAVYKATKQTLERLQASLAGKKYVPPPPETKPAPAPVKKTKESKPATSASSASSSASSVPVASSSVPAATSSTPEPPVQLDASVWTVLGITAAAVVYFVCQSPAVAGVISGFVPKIMSMLPQPAHHMEGYLQVAYLLGAACVCVPAVVRLLPGGSPVLGYLLAGGLIGPHALGLISDVHSIAHIAEMGVVFLLFMIGLELSLERLQSMAKFVFGMGSVQVVLSLLGVAAIAILATGLGGPSAIILGGALAMSSTAVAIQVLEDRKEMASRHGRAIFSVLLFQDLAVVVLLMLIPLLAPSPDGSSGGLGKIAQALGIAGVKAVACIVGIIAAGRVVIQPLYKRISEFNNTDLFTGVSLLVCIGTACITQLAGLSLALGAFLSGLLIAETEYAMQVESDIMPYKGLLMGLFFMCVGMEISMQLFVQKWQEILVTVFALIAGKVGVMMIAGKAFGLTPIQSLRSGLLLAPGSEFAFVAFGEAVTQGVLSAALCAKLYLAVALSMALTPYLAAAGAAIGQKMESGDMKSLAADESETDELSNHVIIMGYGRTGQALAQLLSDEKVPFVALDTSSDRVTAGRAQNMPVYFGDAGSHSVMHHLGAERASCAIVALDTAGANYRAVWSLRKHFPELKMFVRAHDVESGVNLEKAGATAVVPETMEPSLQLAAAVLDELDYPIEEANHAINRFRQTNLNELRSDPVRLLTPPAKIVSNASSNGATVYSTAHA